MIAYNVFVESIIDVLLRYVFIYPVLSVCFFQLCDFGDLRLEDWENYCHLDSAHGVTGWPTG